MKRNKSRQTAMRFDEETGRYCAKLGKKETKSGRLDGHLFRFSANERDSIRRRQRIQELWDHIVDRNGAEALWRPDSLEIALGMAEGQNPVVFKRSVWAVRDGKTIYESPENYARRFHRACSDYPIVSFVPDEPETYSSAASLLKESFDNQLAKVQRTSKVGFQLSPNEQPVEFSKSTKTVAEALDAYEGFTTQSESHSRRSVLFGWVQRLWPAFTMEKG